MRTVALFGQPLRRRHSKVMHDAAFAAAGVDARYELREVDEAALASQVEEARRDRWLGFQITAPHKRIVMGLLDEIEQDARRIGAVNSVAAGDDGRLIGFNTDVIGFLAGLRSCHPGDLAGRSVVLAGSGGVGHAAVYGLATAGVGKLTVLDLAAPRQLAREFADVVLIEPLAFGDPGVDARLAGADVFVNATSVGMLSPGPVVEVDLINRAASVFDVVYIPAQTALVRQARARGMPAANGDRMLVAQAAAAWTRWTGLPDPTEVMREAVAPLLADPGLEP